MAPRRRPRKVGLKRIDAAIDALAPMGFSPELIRRKIKDLLEVYDGDEGWVFIEEASYKLLIESILEEQEGGKGEIGEPSSRNENRREGGMEVELSEAGPSSAASEHVCSNQDATVTSPTTVLELPPPLPTAENDHISPTKNVVLHNEPESSQMGDMFEAQEQITALKDTYFATKKHKPCLGWIGPKDDASFYLLKPAPAVKMVERPKKRKSRWDIGPG